MTTQELDIRNREDERATVTGQGWLLKACNRCGGDLIHDVDEYGDTSYSCLQCGHSQDRLLRAVGTTMRHSRRVRGL